jgi:hypothetical protein
MSKPCEAPWPDHFVAAVDVVDLAGFADWVDAVDHFFAVAYLDFHFAVGIDLDYCGYHYFDLADYLYYSFLHLNIIY